MVHRIADLALLFVFSSLGFGYVTVAGDPWYVGPEAT